MSHENLHHYDLAAGFSFNTYTKLRPKFNIPKSNLSQIFRLFVWVWCRLGKRGAKSDMSEYKMSMFAHKSFAEKLRKCFTNNCDSKPAQIAPRKMLQTFS